VVGHTPGPWNAYEKASGSATGPCTGFNIHSEETGRSLIASVEPRDEDGIEGKANARLIASAPDLLAALVFARDVVKGIDGLKISHGFWDYIDAAIAKAQGTS
jgi:hypothetical protein